MKINYDKIADALYFCIKTGKVAKTIKLRDRLLADLDKSGNIIGIELLNAREQIGSANKPMSFNVRIPAIS
jgi:uncharacterized protein YuzE